MTNTDTTADTTYNGYTNYETWVTGLWIDNEQGSQEAAHELVADVFARDLDDRDARYTAAEALKEWTDEAYNLPTEGLAADLCRRAFGQVNWLELVDVILDAVREADEA